jgi:5-methylcytosine-specific restriction endonuclease McrA
MSVITKRCSKCSEEKVLTEFNRHSGRKDGFATECKQCKHAIDKSYANTHKEALKDYMAGYYATHKEELLQGNRERYQENRSEYLAQQREYRAEHLGEIRARDRARHWTRRDIDIARAAAWSREHRDYVIAQCKARYQANKSRALGDAVKRYLKRKGLSESQFVSDVDRRAIYDRDGGMCQLCHEPVDYDAMHLDHIIPLSKGGTHEPGNVQTAHGFCNRKKAAKVVNNGFFAGIR